MLLGLLTFSVLVTTTVAKDNATIEPAVNNSKEADTSSAHPDILELYGFSEDELLTQIQKMDKLNKIQAQLFHHSGDSNRPSPRKGGRPQTGKESASNTLFDELSSGKSRKPDESRLLFEGDLLLTTQQMDTLIQHAQDQLYAAQHPTQPTRGKRSLVDYPDSQWDASKPLAFSIASEVDRASVLEGTQMWQQNTCIRFEEVKILPRFGLNIIRGNGCYSRLGRIPGPQIVSIGGGCEYPLIVAHEIGHALGLIHEQGRPDRDAYITINEKNIQQYMSAQFHRQSWAKDYGVKYDLGSAMHYDSRAFTRNGQPTILTVDKNYQDTIGQRGYLSFADVKKINLAYCANKCSSQLQCQRGGYPDPNDCSRCRCPTGFGGALCDAAIASAECGKTDLVATDEVQLLSLNGTKSCSFVIRAGAENAEQKIHFRLRHSVFTKKTPCRADYVEIKYGKNMESTGARFCTTSPTVSVSEGNMIVVLYSGNAQSKMSLEYRLHKTTTTGKPIKTQSTTTAPIKAKDECRVTECSAKCGACGTRTRVCPGSWTTEVCNLQPCGGRKCCLPYRKINGICVKGTVFTADDLEG